MGKPLARCMGGRYCSHQPGECTADPAYQAQIAKDRATPPTDDLERRLRPFNPDDYMTQAECAREALAGTPFGDPDMADRLDGAAVECNAIAAAIRTGEAEQ